MRPITLFTGQWADLPLKTMAEKAASWGYQGLELAASGDHLDIDKAATDKKYCKKLLDTLKKNNLKVWAISNHLAGQLTCDPTTTAAPTVSRLPLSPGKRMPNANGRLSR